MTCDTKISLCLLPGVSTYKLLLHFSIVAKDEDSTAQYNTVHYGIHSGNHFHIDQFTGDLFLIKQLDYETDKKYTLQVNLMSGFFFTVF
jgi:hypothetical protein